MIVFPNFSVQNRCLSREERRSTMIDINVSLFYQLANFVVLLVALNFILFKPIRQIMQEREQGISSSFGDAKAAQERMQSLLEQYNSSLAEAKQKAHVDLQRHLSAGPRCAARHDLGRTDQGRRDAGQGAGRCCRVRQCRPDRPEKRSRTAVAGNYLQAARKGGVEVRDRLMKKIMPLLSAVRSGPDAGPLFAG